MYPDDLPWRGDFVVLMTYVTLALCLAMVAWMFHKPRKRR